MSPFERLVESLARAGAQFVVIGLSGANYYARSGSALFVTQDRDLFLRPDVTNVLAAWNACEAVGLELFCGQEPLDRPRDLMLAERVVARRALVRATDGAGLDIDLTLDMAGFEFDEAWAARRIFRVGEIELPVARLRHIIESKRSAGRDKDRLFLATHADLIQDLIKTDSRSAAGRRRSISGRRKAGPRRPSRRRP